MILMWKSFYSRASGEDRKNAGHYKGRSTYERFVLSRAEALKRMDGKGDEYKAELIRELPDDAEVTFYRQGEFTDLCAGPHLMSTGKVKAVKLINLAGAYWRGNEKNKMLQRVYGVSFPKKSILEEHLQKLEEAKKRDHNKLGRELELFMTSEPVARVCHC